MKKNGFITSRMMKFPPHPRLCEADHTVISLRRSRAPLSPSGERVRVRGSTKQTRGYEAAFRDFQRILVSVVFLFFLTGCAAKQMAMTRTGFLSDYSGLKEDEASQGMHVYKNSSASVEGHYAKIIIAPVELMFDPSVKKLKMKTKDREKLTAYFHDQLKKGLSQSYEITDQPGPDVLLFRTAITGVLPNKVYLNLHWSTTLMGAGIGGASLEAELVDSLSGERILAFVDARKGKKLNYTKGLTKWGHTKEVLGIWADLLVMNVKRLKEITMRP